MFFWLSLYMLKFRLLYLKLPNSTPRRLLKITFHDESFLISYLNISQAQYLWRNSYISPISA